MPVPDITSAPTYLQEHLQAMQTCAQKSKKIVDKQIAILRIPVTQNNRPRIDLVQPAIPNQKSFDAQATLISTNYLIAAWRKQQNQEHLDKIDRAKTALHNSFQTTYDNPNNQDNITHTIDAYEKYREVSEEQRKKLGPSEYMAVSYFEKLPTPIIDDDMSDDDVKKTTKKTAKKTTKKANAAPKRVTKPKTKKDAPTGAPPVAPTDDAPGIPRLFDNPNVRFGSYDECISRATSKAFYMSKAELVDTIKKDPQLQQLVGANYAALSKEKICEKLFPK